MWKVIPGIFFPYILGFGGTDKGKGILLFWFGYFVYFFTSFLWRGGNQMFRILSPCCSNFFVEFFLSLKSTSRFPLVNFCCVSDVSSPMTVYEINLFELDASFLPRRPFTVLPKVEEDWISQKNVGCECWIVGRFYEINSCNLNPWHLEKERCEWSLSLAWIKFFIGSSSFEKPCLFQPTCRSRFYFDF